MKWLTAIALGALLIALPATAADRTASRTQTITLVSTTVSVRALADKAPKGKPSKGDVLEEKSELRNAVAQFGRPKGALVGSDVAVATLLDTPRVRFTLTVKLPGGTIRAGGVIGMVGQRIPVVGGTGAFAGARGSSEVRRLDGQGLALNIYRLRIP